MENSLPDPPGSSPPEFDPIDVDLLSNKESIPISPISTFQQFLGNELEPSSDPINTTNSFNFTPIQLAIQSYIPNRKRPTSGNFSTYIDKGPKIATTLGNNPTIQKEARQHLFSRIFKLVVITLFHSQTLIQSIPNTSTLTRLLYSKLRALEGINGEFTS